MEVKNSQLVSVLMPVKNAEPFIRACLDSILSQTYTDWELIAIDDHSTDDSFDILYKYSKVDSRIVILSNEGTGIISALRKAYLTSTGTYITRMDADDLMAPHKLSVLHDNLVKNGTGHLAIGQVKYFSDTGLGGGYKRYESWLNQLTSTGNNFDELYRECAVPSPCWMLHRTDLEKIGAFESGLYPEDYDLAFRMYQGGLNCIPCHEQIHLWRDHPERSSRTQVHYADNRFLSLKCHHFIQYDYDSTRTLVVWGAGSKGKAIVKNLLRVGLSPTWICDNPNKWGHIIYGVLMQPISFVESLENLQIIIAVANDQERTSIEQTLKNKKLNTMQDYFFFC